MLIHLDIRDLAVVSSLDLNLEQGLTVLTGETGAGKSILLTALGLALGDRVDAGFIRPGAQKAEINLGFHLEDSPLARQWLEEQSLADGDECIIRRVIAQDGRSRAFINGRQVTLQSLQELGQGLVEIHGQHAHVQLVKAHEQRRLLDESAGQGERLARVLELYYRWRTLRDDLESRTVRAVDQTARRELLSYQLDELEQHAIADLNYAELVDEHTRQANAGRILEVGQAQLDALYENEGHSVSARLSQALHALTDLSRLDPRFAGALALLGEAQVQVKEASLQLRRDLDHLEMDPRRLEALDQRLADVHRLARKHQVRPEALPEQWAALRDELASISHGAETTAGLQQALEQVELEYRAAAQTLSEQRQVAAIRMQTEISSIIRELGMPQGGFEVAVRTDPAREPGPHGLDEVEFRVSANPGMPMRPLARVASGGELSRISLAIQVAASDSRITPTLVFDEVDTGIGGGIAEIVGQKLRRLARDRQVLCVTHLPQVAAQGHRHLHVEKRSDGGETYSTVRELEGLERTHEVARMLGGVRITDQSLAHALEMLALAEEADC